MILIKTPYRGCSRNKQKVTDDGRMVRLQINVREHRMGHQTRTISRNWQYRVHNATKNTSIFIQYEELYNSIRNISNISCQQRNTDYWEDDTIEN